METLRFVSWQVSAQHAGQRIQNVLVELLKNTFSGKEIKRAIERNALQINGVREKHASRRLALSDSIRFDLTFLSLQKPVKDYAFAKERLLYEDDYFIIYNKPFGITSDGGGLLDQLQHYDSTLRNIHRLDKETTGALIFSKGSKGDVVRQHFIELFRARKIDKRYLALVAGCIKQDGGRIEKPIGKLGEHKGQIRWGIKSLDKGGVEALTEWKVLRRGVSASLLECTLLTGRTHQIRIHLSDMGHPIIGDVLYGTTLNSSFKGSFQPAHQLLHAWRLRFNHPITNKTVQVEAPLSAEFTQANCSLIQASDLSL